MTRRRALRSAAPGKQAAGCPSPVGKIEPPREDADTLVDMAIAHGDEHAIKFIEACSRQHALNPLPAYLAAARNALDALPRA